MTNKPLIGLSKEEDLNQVIDTDDITNCFQSIEIPEFNVDTKMEEKKKILPPKPPSNGRSNGREGTFDF